MKALVIYKISLFERLRAAKELERLQKDVRQRFFASDLENRQSIHHVFYELVRHKVEFDLISRDSPTPKKKYDLNVIVGGDGTLFSVAHYTNTPCLLVNSDPKSSLGIFSSCNRLDFAEKLESILNNKIQKTKINRINIWIGREKLNELVVNDILFAHTDPASMTRYFLTVDGKTEYQESSGIWVCTAAGSSAAVYSSGGKLMPIKSTKMQFTVREPYTFRSKFKMIKGFASKRIIIRPVGINCSCWIDGSRTTYKVSPGQQLTLETPGPPITILGYNERSRIKLHR